MRHLSVKKHVQITGYSIFFTTDQGPWAPYKPDAVDEEGEQGLAG